MSSSEIAPNPFAITLFGPMQVRVQGHLLPALRSRKALWLLALLTLRHGRPVEREWLAGTLWPDMDQSQAFANLRPVISDLRRALGSQRERLQSPGRHTLLLDLAGAEVDLLAFDAAIAGKKLSALEQAVTLYHGPLLEGCTEEWVSQERRVREQNCLQALQKLGDAALTAGDYGAAVGYYQRGAALDPWWEAARRGWMEALAKSGDVNAAMQVYREFVAVLKSDPKAVPDEQTTGMYQRLRAEVRRRTDTHAGVTAEASPAPVVKGYLPHPLTDLVGREDERVEVALQLRRSRLVTLTGFGGIGKTRLAIEVAAEVVREYADGVWLVTLEALADDKLVLRQIASSLGSKEEAGRPLLQSMLEHLRKKRLLLVLDNCEHLLEASAEIVGHLLRECAEVRILATSREALGITGETVWAVPALAFPPPEHLPQGSATLLRVVMGYESVRLFVERAQSVHNSFALSGSNARTVAEVCARLEGIPLAIEFAAARIKAMPLEQIASRLKDYLGLLTSGNRVALSRQQTLRATLDWSYTLLTERERLLLQRLSVFAGGWTLEAAEAICAAEGREQAENQEHRKPGSEGSPLFPFPSSLFSDDVLDLLTSLVDKSLVAFEEREEVSGRYRLLDIVRQYALAYLQTSPERKQVRFRHHDWFLALAEEADAAWNGPEQGKWMRCLEREHGNLRAALEWEDAEGHDGETGLRLANALARFWYTREEYSEGRHYLERALERDRTKAVTLVRADALNKAGAMAFRLRDYASARTWYEESLRVRRELGNKQGMAQSLNNLANIAHALGDYATVQTSYQDTLGIFQELGDRRNIAWSLNGLANITQVLGDYASACKLHEESLNIYRELGDRHGIAQALNSLGEIMRELGDYASARALHEEGLDLSREIGDRHGIAWSLSSLGDAIHRQGEYEAAQALLKESLSLRRQSGDRYAIAWVLDILGKVARACDDHASARAYHEESLSLFKELNDRHGMGWALYGLGDVANAQHNAAMARACYNESLTLFRDLRDKSGLLANLRGLAPILLERGAAQEVIRLWAAAQVLIEDLGPLVSPRDQAVYDRQVGQARSAIGEDAFTAAWEEGHALGWEQAIESVLNDGK